MSSLSISLAEQTKSQAFLEVGKKVAAVFTAAVVSLPNGGSSLSPIAQYVGEVQQVCQYQSQGIEPVTPAYNGITVSLTESVPMLESSRNIQKLREFGEYKANWNGYGAEAFDSSYIESAIRLIKTIPIQPDIYPLTDGRIQMEFSKEAGQYLEFELNKDSTVEVFRINEDSSEDEFEDVTGNIAKIVAEFYG